MDARQLGRHLLELRSKVARREVRRAIDILQHERRGSRIQEPRLRSGNAQSRAA
jgi:hypothetical protein